MECLGLSEMLLCKLEQILCCSQESQLENTTDTFCPPAAFDSARKTREGLFPKWKCYDKWAWGGLIEVCLSSTLTLWLPHFLFLSTFASLAHTHYLQPNPSLITAVWQGGLSFFVSLQLFTPSLKLRIPFPTASRPHSPTPHSPVLPLHSHLLLCRNGGYF